MKFIIVDTTKVEKTLDLIEKFEKLEEQFVIERKAYCDRFPESNASIWNHSDYRKLCDKYNKKIDEIKDKIRKLGFEIERYNDDDELHVGELKQILENIIIKQDIKQDPYHGTRDKQR